MKNLLLLIEHIQGGGAERIMCELSVALEKKYNVILVVFEERKTNYEHCQNMINLNIPGTSNFFKKCFNLVKRVMALKKIKKSKKIDISISFMSTANIVNVLSGVTYNICSIRTVLSAVAVGNFTRRVERFILNRADKIVTLSKSVEQDLNSNFGIEKEKLLTIYNPCNIDRIHQEEFIIEKEKSNFIIITAGRLVPQKGQWHLIKAFDLFQKTHPESKLVILGEGKLFQSLLDLAISLGIEEKIDFKGFVSNPIQEFLKADIFVLSSIYEGFGNVITEAMACGLPIISVDCAGGPGEIIAPNRNKQEIIKEPHIFEYGVLTPAFPKTDLIISKDLEVNDTEKQLCKAMTLLADNTQLRSSLVAKSLSRAKDFELSKIASQWESLIREVSISEI